LGKLQSQSGIRQDFHQLRNTAGLFFSTTRQDVKTAVGQAFQPDSEPGNVRRRIAGMVLAAIRLSSLTVNQATSG